MGGGDICDVGGYSSPYKIPKRRFGGVEGGGLDEDDGSSPASRYLYCTRALCGTPWGSNVIVWREAPGHIGLVVLHAAGWVPDAVRRAKWLSCPY